MMKKAKKIEGIHLAIKEIEDRFLQFSSSMNLHILYEKNNKDYVLTSFSGMPTFEIKQSISGNDLTFYFSWFNIDPNEVKRREEPNTDIFGSTIESIFEWQKIKSTYKETFSDHISPNFLNNPYYTYLKEKYTCMKFDLPDCIMVEIYPWGYYIKTSGIFSIVSSIYCKETSECDILGAELQNALYQFSKFEWPALTRDFSLLECFWQKEDENTEIMDELLYKTDYDDIDAKDYRHLDI